MMTAISALGAPMLVAGGRLATAMTMFVTLTHH